VNLAELLLAPASRTPGAPALFAPSGGHADRVVTYGELSERAARVSAVLRIEGVEPGDRVALVAPSPVDFVVAYLAVLWRGAVAVPLNPAAPAPELEREVRAVEPRLALLAGHGGVGGLPGIGLDRIELPETLPAPVERADDDLAVLLFTAGTAGAPRAAMLSHGNLAANIRQVLDRPGLRLEPSDVGLGALPLFHVFGLNVVVGVALAAGASVALVDHFDPRGTLDTARDRGVTVIAGVPAMYAAWLALDDAQAPPESFAGVRLAVSGAAPLPRDVADAFHERFGVVVHEGYGLTEAAPIVSTTATGSGLPEPGSIGAPLPGIEVRVVDADGADVLAGDPGEIWLRGPNVFRGYWHEDAATARVLTADGWLRTGDVAVVDERGELRLVDRAKDLVIVSGFNVYPAEVEEVLMSHPRVAEAAVVGEPDARTGEAVVAYVTLEPGPPVPVESLAAHCAAALARYKCPSRIVVLDELPHTLAGKLLRRELRGR
jgi:long-chain acyl-CoA synthetase